MPPVYASAFSDKKAKCSIPVCRVLKYILGIINSHSDLISQQHYCIILIASNTKRFINFKKLDKLIMGENFIFNTQNQNIFHRGKY